MSSVRWSRLAVSVPLIAGAVLFGACGDDDDDGGGAATTVPDGPTTTATPVDVETVAALVPTADIAAGEDVFGSNCSSCHGSDGGGGIGPNLQEVADRLTVEEQAEVVIDGRGNMPAWGGELSAEEIAAVIRYTREGL